MGNLASSARDLTQVVAAATTLVVATEAPADVTPFPEAGGSTWRTSPAGFLDVVNDPLRRERFVSVDDDDVSVIPRPVGLLVVTAAAHQELVAKARQGLLDPESYGRVAERVAVLDPDDVLLTSCNFHRMPGNTPTQVPHFVLTRSAAETPPAGDPLLSLTADDADASALLRERNLRIGLMSRVLRMQQDVDNFRLLAEKALTAKRAAERELAAIKRSPRYRLALLGVSPIEASRKGRKKLAKSKPEASAE